MELLLPMDRLGFLEADATLGCIWNRCGAGRQLVTEELPPDQRPKYIANFIGSKQKAGGRI